MTEEPDEPPEKLDRHIEFDSIAFSKVVHRLPLATAREVERRGTLRWIGPFG
jgi:hypothetical protein